MSFALLMLARHALLWVGPLWWRLRRRLPPPQRLAAQPTPLPKLLQS